MGYYCTVPQCTSLAGKTKNVKFHRFPRDEMMAKKWNVILKRGKPYTKYSKVCSLHFTQADYNVTTMGQWKTLSKDAVPTQNLPKVHPDGTVMVIRKSRTVKYKDSVLKRECDTTLEKANPWMHALSQVPPQVSSTIENALPYRIEASVTPIPADNLKPQKQDAFMQTEPVLLRELVDTEDPTNSSEASQQSYNSENVEQYTYSKEQLEAKANMEVAKDEVADKYGGALTADESKVNFERNIPEYQNTDEEFDESPDEFLNSRDSLPELYQEDQKNNIAESYPQTSYEETKPFEYNRSGQLMQYQNYVNDAVELLRNQQHNLQILQQQQMLNTNSLNQNFTQNLPIKQEIGLAEDDKCYYCVPKPEEDESSQIKVFKIEPVSEPVPENGMGNDGPYEPPPTQHAPETMYYAPNEFTRPGPELLIAKQNALAAHTQLWQNTMKRPFFYSDTSHYNALFAAPRSEDLARILNQ